MILKLVCESSTIGIHNGIDFVIDFRIQSIDSAHVIALWGGSCPFS